MERLKNKYWYLKPILLFIIIYIWNNEYLRFLTLFLHKTSYNFQAILIYIIPYSIFIVIYYFFLKKPSFNKQIKTPIVYLSWLFLIIYLTAFIKSDFNSNNHLQPTFKVTISIIIFLFSQLLLAPVIEELFFRELLLSVFIKKNKVVSGIIITSFLFALAHFPLIFDNSSFSTINFLDLFVFGIILSFIRIIFSIKYSIIAHSFRNILVFLYNYNIINLFFIDKIHSEKLFTFTYVSIVFIITFSIIYLYRLLNKQS